MALKELWACYCLSGSLFHIICNIVPVHLECDSISSGIRFQLIFNSVDFHIQQYANRLSGEPNFISHLFSFDRSIGVFNRSTYGLFDNQMQFASWWVSLE